MEIGLVAMRLFLTEAPLTRKWTGVPKSEMVHYTVQVIYWASNIVSVITAGWQLCIQWKDGLTSWEKLSDMKESHPIETAKYAVALRNDLPSFLL